jgi:DHA1 family multidrug resistance protein-like MFS transporter
MGGTDARQGLIRRPAVLGLVAIALAAELGYAVLNISTMPVYLRGDRHFGEGTIGLVLVAFLLSEAVFKGFMGRLADRFGSKPFMVLGPALSFTACILTFLIPKTGGSPSEIAELMGLRVIDGVAAASFWPAAFAYVGLLTEEDRRQEAMSLLNLCYLLGLALALPLGGLIDDLTRSHQAGLVLAAGLFGTAALLSFAIVRMKSSPTVTEASESHGRPDFKLIAWPVALTLVTFVGVGFPMAILKLFSQDALHLTETQFGALVIPGALVMAGLSVPVARIGERLGSARSVHLGLGLCAAGMMIIGLGAWFPDLRNVILLAVAAAPVGLGFTLALPAWMASVSAIDSSRQGANLGAVMAAQGFGAILGAPLGGVLYEKLQPLGLHLGLGREFGYYSPFFACGVCVTAGWALSLFATKPSGSTS